jgi:hypothetical protein
VGIHEGSLLPVVIGTVVVMTQQLRNVGHRSMEFFSGIAGCSPSRCRYFEKSCALAYQRVVADSGGVLTCTAFTEVVSSVVWHANC